jgi:hemerythrin
MLIDKRDIPEVAIASMNTTHENEIDIINTLYELITKNLEGQSVETNLAQAVETFATHVEEHFSGEEEMMEKTGFPAFSVHKNEHDRVRAELFGIIATWRENKNIQPLADYLKNIHPVWAKNHIATMDAMTAYFILQARNTSKVG